MIDTFGLGDVRSEKIAVNLTGDFLGVLFVARMNDHFRALARERPGDTQSDIMRRSRHQRGLIFEQHLHPPANSW